MSRRAPRPRNVLRIARFLTVLVAVTAVVVGTVAPVTVATASASQSTVNLSRASVDSTQLNVVKTSLDGFKPGNLISDAVFTNKNTMTAAQIQSFFNDQVSKCRAGYTCLKDFKITSVTRPADAYCKGYKGVKNETAARIIYRVAQSCNINPHVLIVMLQKEQGLITHTWPSQWRYDMALGQGCPDTAPCDPNFVGFFHQIYGAARQMQIYMEGKWFQWYAPGKTWNIQYHPNRSCGTSPVYIANKATAALYYYTPYQPNAAALKAGRGTGDACSSYGNRNFYNYFTDWFGSTQSVKPTKPTTPPAPKPPKPPKPTKPTKPKPKLGSIDTSEFVVTLDKAGQAWAYPFAKNAWGDRVMIASGLTGYKNLFSVGDLRGTGHRDLIGIAANGVAWLIPGTGKNTFGTPRTLTGAWKNATLIAPAGDFNGDGIPDVVTTDSKGRLLLWRGQENGTFASGTVIGTGWQIVDRLVGGYDMTRDSNVDLVARWKDGKLKTYTGNGNGRISGTIEAGHGWQKLDKIMVVRDFNGDRRPDILASDSKGALKSYPGLGNGRVKTGATVGNGWQHPLAAYGAGPAADKARIPSAGVGDIDKDGARDILAIFGPGQLRNYRGNGAGAFAGFVTLNTGWKPTDKLLNMGDFDGDGIADVGRITKAGILSLHSGNGNGTYIKGRQIGHGWDKVDAFLSGFDFNGDGIPDVLVRRSSGALILYTGNGSGGFAAHRPQVGTGWNVIKDAFYGGDFNRDGSADVIARKTDGTLWLYPITGTGAWKAPQKIGHGWQHMTAVTSPGDFSGDGRADILARTPKGDLVLYRGNGAGGFLGATTIGNGWNQVSQIR